MSTRNLRFKAILTTAVLISAITLASVLYWLSQPIPEEDGVPELLTAWEFKRSFRQPVEPGSIYLIKDTPIEAELRYLPGLDYDNSSTEILVDPGIKMTYTYVKFESLADMTFIADRRMDFPLGTEVTFLLEAKEYDLPGYTFVTVEPFYVWRLFHHTYEPLMGAGAFSPIDLNVTVENSTVTLEIVGTTEFFPMPRNWSQVVIKLYDSGIGVEPQGVVELYDDDVLFAEMSAHTFKYANRTVDAPVEAGHRIVVPRFEGYDSILVRDHEWTFNIAWIFL